MRRGSPDLRNFYPRPPRGGRHLQPPADDPQQQISIHALREEGDRRDGAAGARPNISIHALREEGDGITDQTYDYVEQFLSTPSARRATADTIINDAAVQFLSTPSARRATNVAGHLDKVN